MFSVKLSIWSLGYKVPVQSIIEDASKPGQKSLRSRSCLQYSFNYIWPLFHKSFIYKMIHNPQSYSLKHTFLIIMLSWKRKRSKGSTIQCKYQNLQEHDIALKFYIENLKQKWGTGNRPEHVIENKILV